MVMGGLNMKRMIQASIIGSTLLLASCQSEFVFDDQHVKKIEQEKNKPSYDQAAEQLFQQKDWEGVILLNEHIKEPTKLTKQLAKESETILKAEQLLKENNFDEAQSTITSIQQPKNKEVVDSLHQSIQSEKTKYEEEKKKKPLHAQDIYNKIAQFQQEYERAQSEIDALPEFPSYAEAFKPVADHEKKLDDLLNELYAVLKAKLPPAEFNQLKQEQIQWIQAKEADLNNSWNSLGGSAAQHLANQKSIQWTEEKLKEWAERYGS